MSENNDVYEGKNSDTKLKNTRTAKSLIAMLVCLVLAFVFLFISIKNKPQKYDISTVSYEEVKAKVVNTSTRKIKSSKYTYRTYYDVTLEYEDRKYTWTTSDNDPKLLSGSKYDFILYEGKMYRNVQELQSNLTIINSPFIFKAASFLAVVSFAGSMVCIAMIFAKNKK